MQITTVSLLKLRLLSYLLETVDPVSLSRRDLLLFVDLLTAALAVPDASPDFGEEFLSR